MNVEETRVYDNLSVKFAPSPPNALPVNVCLPDGTKYPVTIDANFDGIAARAVERIRNRRQWRRLSSAREYMDEISGRYFADLGWARDQQLQKIAKARVVEIQIPVGTGDSAYIFPWEFALSEITAPIRGSRPVLILRYLINAPNPQVQGVAPASVLVSQSAPGALGDYYSFESEDKLVQSSFSNVNFLPTVSDSTVEALQQVVTTSSPGVLHLTGVDGLQGASLLKVTDEPSGIGVYLAGPDGEPLLITPEQMATAVTTGNPKPLLVSYNFYNSSWPLASTTVTKGAAAAIGFQDEIDDAMAELFFARLYETWQRSSWNLLVAYREALKSLGEYAAKLRGTGIVLWSAASLLPYAQSSTSATSPQTTSSPESLLSPTTFSDLGAAIRVVVEPCPKLNYSMLHNNRPMFNKFEVKRQTSGRLVNVRVDVQLNTGAADAVYSMAFDLSRDRPMVDVSALARVSLTSDMARSLRESVYTSLLVNVYWEDRMVYSNTFRVALLPTDEWRDDELNRIWLPSFVLPRDPVIAQVIDKAQKYLSSLQDDAGAGFDGYQGVLAPGIPMDQRCQSVDEQVRAIWWSLMQEYQVGYINPPPSFTEMSQRLRTPSDIIEGGRGTCIDLTLLLAALLEYVDIYPVIFLLQGHAFPGYLRSEESYDELRTVFLEPATMIKKNGSTQPDSNTQREWILDQRYYSAIVQLVRDGHVAPIESVALTRRAGFADAIEQGTENLRSKSDFQFLVDIKSAREADVTPIPMWSISS
jgi:hypothetical protein